MTAENERQGMGVPDWTKTADVFVSRDGTEWRYVRHKSEYYPVVLRTLDSDEEFSFNENGAYWPNRSDRYDIVSQHAPLPPDHAPATPAEGREAVEKSNDVHAVEIAAISRLTELANSYASVVIKKAPPHHPNCIEVHCIKRDDQDDTPPGFVATSLAFAVELAFGKHVLMQGQASRAGVKIHQANEE